MSVNATEYLEKISAYPDEKIGVAKAAVALAALEKPGISLESYFSHLNKMVKEVTKRHHDLLEANAEDTVETMLASLKHVVADHYGYSENNEDSFSVFDFDMIDVIDKRKGLPLALCILYLNAGKGQKWDISVMRIPGHNVLRLERDGKRVIFDPSAECRIMQAADLRAQVKKTLGEDAELSADYYEPPGNLELVIRFQNILKYRRIELEDYPGALKIVEGLRKVAPDEYRLLLDSGVLYARLDRPLDAIDALEQYIEVAPDVGDRHDAGLLLQHIRDTLAQ